jgi:UDP-N-acetylglucosamine pyrophosphorylase
MGTLCRRAGRVIVVEYSEIQECEEEKHRWGNTGMHMYALDLVTRPADAEMPYHAARKTENVIGQNDGAEVVDVCKLERFVFNAFELCEEVALVSCVRENELAPVKNGSGEIDSPEAARDLMLALHGRCARAQLSQP